MKTSPAAIKIQDPNYKIIAIGASVGGPQALHKILSKLPEHFPVPIVIVQHITVGFLEGFCTWLNQHCALSVKCAKNHEILEPGTVYFAPEECHLEIKSMGSHLVSHIKQSPKVSGFKPSITVLFQSVAKSCGKKAIGLLLTGMGNDGAQGLLELKQKKGLTLIQDEQSSVVFGMGKVALTLDAVEQIIDLDRIASYLTQKTQRTL